MGIRKTDKNFDTAVVAPEDLEWFSLRSLPFTVCGVSLFANGKFADTVMPSYEQIASADSDYLGFFVWQSAFILY